MKQLVRKFNFTPVIVPNLVYEDIVQGCGFNTRSKRSQVYTIDGRNDVNWNAMTAAERDAKTNSVCLTGTAEIPLVGLHLGKRFDADSEEKSEQLPKRYCALGRSYRAESSTVETGMYRRHYFSKVEMVALTRQEDAEATLLEFVEIQKYLYTQLGLHFKVLDMPPHELGLPAHRKFDMEAHFAGRGIWGEISSASDCTDYQSRRFNIKYRYLAPDYKSNEPFKELFVSTVNGTAVSSPRILLPLIEGNQDAKGRIRIPEVLRDEMNGQEFLNKLQFS
jgi:seryl-tRNA synthetase